MKMVYGKRSPLLQGANIRVTKEHNFWAQQRSLVVWNLRLCSFTSSLLTVFQNKILFWQRHLF